MITPSVYKLNALVSKCGNEKDKLIWVLQGIKRMVTTLKIMPNNGDFSVDGLRGTSKTGNRGLTDVLFFKKSAVGFLFGRLPITLEIEGSGQWMAEARAALSDHDSFEKSKAGEGLLWRNALTQAQGRYVAFAEELVFGKHYDAVIKSVIRSGRYVDAIPDYPGLKEAIDDVRNLRSHEEREAEKATTVDATSTEVGKLGDDDLDPGDEFVIRVVAAAEAGKDQDTATPKEIKWKDLNPDVRSEWQRACDYVKRQVENYVHLLVMPDNEEATITSEILQTPAGKFEGGAKTNGRTRFVAVVCDTRVLGEASARPAVRMPPVSIDTVHKLLSGVWSRHGELAKLKKLHPFDLYITLAGGRELGSRFYTWFNQKGPPATHSRNVHVFLAPQSSQDRYSRVKGVASNKTHDIMRLTAAPWPKKDLITTTRKHYAGTSAADSLGPVTLRAVDDEESWVLTWAEKKLSTARVA